MVDYVEARGIPSADEWHEIVPSVIEHGLGGLALEYDRRYGHTLAPALRSHLREIEFARSSLTERMLRATMPVLDAIAAADIPFVVTKGPAFSSGGPALVYRSYSDLDILVPTCSYRDTLNLLSTIGMGEHARSVPPRAIYRSFCQEAMNLKSPEGGSLDVHQRIPPWLWGRHLTFESLHLKAATVTTPYGDLPVVSLVDALLIAALHIVSDHGAPGTKLRNWRDLVSLSHIVPPEEATLRAQSFGLVGWLMWVVCCLPAAARPSPLLEKLAAVGAEPLHPARLRCLVKPSVQQQLGLAQCLRLPASRWPVFIASMALPSNNFLAARYPSSRLPLARWWTHLITTAVR